VLRIWTIMDNEHALQADNAQLAAAALDLRPGQTLWFADDFDQPSLLVWLWQRAWIVFVLGFLALAAALWRGLPRFGPRQALPLLERRSMAEQIIGSGPFLARNDSAALHQAALRALDEAARRRLPPRYARQPPAERATMIAAVTHQNVDTLINAMSETRRAPLQLETDLRCLETAARRLREHPLHP
jgi:hypothetical protein